jgi:hypothetical protein
VVAGALLRENMVVPLLPEKVSAINATEVTEFPITAIMFYLGDKANNVYFLLLQILLAA